MRRPWLARVMVFGVLAVANAANAVHAQGIYEPPPGRNFEGVWLIQGEHSAVRTIDGKVPPMTPAAARQYAAAVRSRKAGKADFDTIQTCRPHGFPRILFAA